MPSCLFRDCGGEAMIELDMVHSWWIACGRSIAGIHVEDEVIATAAEKMPLEGSVSGCGGRLELSAARPKPSP